MDDQSAWCPCQFGPDGLLVPNVHDHFVYAVAVHLEQRVLILHTQYRDGTGPYPFVDLKFVGTVAHFFHDLIAPSIVLDLEQVEAPWLIQQWGDLFASRLRYGWPLPHVSDLTDLSQQLVAQRVSGYCVMGSCGLDGFVLASSVDHRSRSNAAELDS